MARPALSAVTEPLLRSYLSYYLPYLGCVALVTVIAAVALEGAWPWALLAVPAGVLVFEFALRLLLRGTYGPPYLNAIFLYLLIDHPRYGTGLRAGADVRAFDGYVFDNFAFPPGAGRILDPAENKAARVAFTVNSLGFRGAEFSPQEKRGRLRIFCIGGSTTAGDSCSDAEAWPARLEAQLRARGYECEVINAGAEGWYSYQNYLRLQDEIAQYRPDVVLAHEGWNEEFQYSSLSLGKRWRPRLLRNVRASHQLYGPANALSSARVLSIFLLVRALRKRFVFIPNMRFENPGRWRVLLSRDYLVAWFDNLAAMAEVARDRGFLFWALDYPGLPTVDDRPAERDAYFSATRLTPLYADYQAIAKERVSEFLRTAAPVAPSIDVSRAFPMRGAERAALFFDELHMRPAGNALFAEALAERLSELPAFRERYEQGTGPSNIAFDAADVARIRAAVGRDSHALRERVERRIAALEGRKDAPAREVPADRYTTH